VTRVAEGRERRRRRRNLLLLWAAQFLNTAGLMMLVPVMPLHLAVLGVDGADAGLWAGLAVAAPALPLAISTPLWGRLGDQVGRKWMVVRALLGLAAGMGVMAAARDPALFVAGRLLQGAVGGVVEAAAAFVGADAADKGRGSALGRSYSATAAGSLVGPVLGGAFVVDGGLTTLMVATASAALVMAMVCAAGLREDTKSQRAPAGLGLAGPWAQAPGRSWAARTNPALLAGAFLAYFGVYGLIPVYATHVGALVADQASAALWIGVLHAVMWGGTLIGSPWWGRRNDRSASPVRTFAIAAGVAGVVIVAQAWAPSPAALAPLRLIQGFCFAALAQSVVLHASRNAPPDRRGGHVGAANSFLLAGQFTGPLVAGGVQGLLSPGLTVVLTGLAVAAAASTAWLAPGPGRHRVRRSPRIPIRSTK
jgi:MFS family permease